jgi:hypothetical protein
MMHGAPAWVLARHRAIYVAATDEAWQGSAYLWIAVELLHRSEPPGRAVCHDSAV